MEEVNPLNQRKIWNKNWSPWSDLREKIQWGRMILAVPSLWLTLCGRSGSKLQTHSDCRWSQEPPWRDAKVEQISRHHGLCWLVCGADFNIPWERAISQVPSWRSQLKLEYRTAGLILRLHVEFRPTESALYVSKYTSQ